MQESKHKWTVQRAHHTNIDLWEHKNLQSTSSCSYLHNVTIGGQSAVSQAVMMQGMLQLIKRERSLALWDCRITPALSRGQSAEVMHASSYSYNALVWLWTGGCYTCWREGSKHPSLWSPIVRFLKHDIEPDCQSKPELILL